MSLKEKINIRDYISFDIETTALKPDRNYGFIIEIGAVKVIDNKIVERFDMFCKPNISIPKKISEITGITDKDVSDAEGITSVLYKFKEFIGDIKYIIGHNSERFDWPFITFWSNETNIDLSSKINLDTLNISRELINPHSLIEKEQEWLRKKGKNKISYSLEALAYVYGIEDKNHHRADNDAEVTHNLFQILKKEFGTNEEKIISHEKYEKQIVPSNLYLISLNYWERGKVKRLYIDVTDEVGNTIRKGTVFYDFLNKKWGIKQAPFPILSFNQIEDKTKKIFHMDDMKLNKIQNKRVYFGQNSY